MTLLARTLALALVLSSAALAQAQAPRRPVQLAAEGIFGNETLLGDGYDAISVTATNATTATLRGRVEISVRQWQQPEQLVEVPLDLPASEARRVTATVFVGDSSTIEVRYVVDGAPLASTALTAVYGQSARALVVMADPSRLRGSLLDLTTNVTSGSFGFGGGGTTSSGVPLGVVSYDARTGDPILPTTALGWSNVAVVAASAPTLARMSDEQRDALEGWVHSGGRVVVFPRTDADFATPFVHAHFPSLHRGEDMVRVDGQPALPALDCGPAHRETFGCSIRVGFGAAYVADFDGAASPFVELPSTRAIVSALVDQANGRFDPVSPVLVYGRHTDQTGDSYGYYGGGTRLSFGRLRAALDPNEGYRPALALVGVLLFFYVLVVGPLNFWWVGRRKNPTLALFTTPLIAAICAAVMFFVGYVGKGVLMRYRRVELVDVVEGDGLGTARRYTGFYFTRPASMETGGPERGGVFRVLGGSGGIVHEGDTHATLRAVTGGLWETVFTREEHQVGLGTGVSFTLDDRRLAAVVNGTGTALHSAFVVDAGGNLYVVGEVPAGGSAPIPRDPSAYLPPSGFYDVHSTEVMALRDALGLVRGDETYALGLANQIGTLSAGLVPVLYARMDPDPAPVATPGFSAERDLRILRVVPALPVPDVFLGSGSISSVEATPAVPTDPMGAALHNLFGAGGTP